MYYHKQTPQSKLMMQMLQVNIGYKASSHTSDQTMDSNCAKQILTSTCTKSRPPLHIFFFCANLMDTTYDRYFEEKKIDKQICHIGSNTKTSSINVSHENAIVIDGVLYVCVSWGILSRQSAGKQAASKEFPIQNTHTLFPAFTSTNYINDVFIRTFTRAGVHSDIQNA